VAVAVIDRKGLRGSRTGSAAVLLAILAWSFSNTLVKVSTLPALTFAFRSSTRASGLPVPTPSTSVSNSW